MKTADSEQSNRDEDWTARELIDDALEATGDGTINLPYLYSDLQETETRTTVTFSTVRNHVSLGQTWDDDGNIISVMSHLSPDQARELAHDLEQAALRVEEADD